MWCNMVLDDLTKRITEVLLQMSADELILVQNVSPQGCAKMVAAACQHQHNQNSCTSSLFDFTVWMSCKEIF